MNEATISMIIELVKAGSGLLKDIIPVLVHRDASGNVTQVSPVIILEATDSRNMATLAAIAALNSQPVKPTT